MQHLIAADPVLAPVIQEHGLASVLIGKDCVNVFDSLTRSILSQQLATGAAAAITARFKTACKCEPGGKVTPAAVQSVSVAEMRACGLSGRKAEYVLDLARHFAEGLLSDEAIAGMDDEALVRELVKVKGIGRWSVDMFAMFHLGRPDVLPVGDLGVRKGMQTLYRLKALPEAAEMERLTDAWRPYRSLGSYYMWRVPTQRASSTPGKKKRAAKAAVPTVLAE
ncbi:hypothetical protein WJX72_009248 [[Myrmecia] bisecta]|uniref:HhH-GPD domain-containing protein n=1 Tax=[Myrmecia] bisecta TaxID=41462 RepID=A0AAW1R8R4_9CHLO